MRFGLVVAVLAAHPLASDDAGKRLAAVEQWARGHKPQLVAKDAKALTACVDLPAVPESGCTEAARLCPVREGDDGASGTRTESLSFILDGHEELHRHLRVWWRAAYEPRRQDCDPPESMTHEELPAQRKARVEEWRRTHAAEWRKCIARAEKDAEDDAEEVNCDVVLVNACRREAYLVCKSRNVRAGIATLNKLHRFEF